MRGENLTVMTPSFDHFSNDIANITSRNELICKAKRMCMERGFRGKLSMSTITEAKSLHIIVLCDKSKKATLKSKNPSKKGLCPFLVHYERKSFIGVNRGYKGEEFWDSERLLSKPKLSGPQPYRPLNQIYDDVKNNNQNNIDAEIKREESSLGTNSKPKTH